MNVNFIDDNFWGKYPNYPVFSNYYLNLGNDFIFVWKLAF